MKHSKKLKSFLKVWLYWVAVFLIVSVFWITMHESSHAMICRIIGGNPSLIQILPNPMMSCEGIVINNHLVVSKFQYFMYAIIPYIIASIVLLIFKIYKKINTNIQLALIPILMIDVLWNYLSSIKDNTDFRFLAIVSNPLFYISILIPIFVLLLGMNILKERWVLLKKRFIYSIKKGK